MINNEIIVPPEENGMRIDKILIKHFPELSRRAIRDFFKTGYVILNGKKTEKGVKVKTGDRIIFDREFLLSHITDFSPEPLKSQEKNFLKIIYKDKNIIAVNKPPGIDCAPIRKRDTRTLLSMVIESEPSVASVQGWKKREGGLIYRLDREVSGVLVFALNQRTFDWLLSLTRQNLIKKRYLAITENQKGTRLLKKGVIIASKPILKYSGKVVAFEKIKILPDINLEHFFKIKNKQEKFSEPAFRKYFAGIIPLGHHGNLSLISIEITRAFRHEIRSILSYSGNPIVGDLLYGSSVKTEDGRIFLHLSEIEIPNLQGEKPVVIKADAEEILNFYPQFKNSIKL